MHVLYLLNLGICILLLIIIFNNLAESYIFSFWFMKNSFVSMLHIIELNANILLAWDSRNYYPLNGHAESSFVYICNYLQRCSKETNPSIL